MSFVNFVLVFDKIIFVPRNKPPYLCPQSLTTSNYICNEKQIIYLISAACLLSYTGTFTSCVNGVDDEYLEQKMTNSTTSSEDELPDLNGEYSMVGDYDLEMTCNGDLLEGQKVVMAVDEKNESATITFTAVETDLESVIGLIQGANLIQGMGLKYTGNCPVPGEKELYECSCIQKRIDLCI